MIIVPQLNLRHIKMQKSKFVKNPAVRDTWKITSNLPTHDTLICISYKNELTEKSSKLFFLLFIEL